jgi:hypothetical protein
MSLYDTIHTLGVFFQFPTNWYNLITNRACNCFGIEFFVCDATGVVGERVVVLTKGLTAMRTGEWEEIELVAGGFAAVDAEMGEFHG